MQIAFVVDPLAALDRLVDTSLALMRAALARGDDVWAVEARQLEVVEGRARALATRVGPGLVGVGPEQVWLDDMAAVFMRVDPPVDRTYLAATYVLDLVDPGRTAMVNDPRGLRACNEKLYPFQFPDLVPETVVTAEAATIMGFVGVHQQAVLKPVDGFAGHGVLLLDRDDPNLHSLVEISTQQGRTAVVVQRFLPEVVDGNKRLFVLDGEPTAAVWRHPAEGDFRIGSPTCRAPIDARDRELCARLAPSLRAHGLRMVGLDVIGGLLIEVNVTSPGALRKADLLLGTSWCADAVDVLTRT